MLIYFACAYSTSVLVVTEIEDLTKDDLTKQKHATARKYFHILRTNQPDWPAVPLDVDPPC